jgi:hypothetical protein
VSTVLKDLLNEVAEDAKPYDVRQRALRAGKRRRRARRVTPGLVALAVVLTGVGLAVLRPSPAPVPFEPALPPPITLPGYPAAVTPRPDAPRLPNDRAPGRGAIVYVDRAFGYFLVTADGAQYSLGKIPEGDSTTYTLSPDRRWLVSSDRQSKSQTVLRDLTGTAYIEFGGFFTAVAWSPDGRWLALGLYGAGDPGRVRLIDLHALVIDPNGLEVDLHGFPQAQVASVLGDGRLVLAKLGAYAFPDLTIVDPHTLAQQTVTVDTTGHTSPQERMTLAESAAIGAMIGLPQPMTFTTDGRVLLQLTRSAWAAGEPIAPGATDDVLVIDLERQVVVQRWALPTPKPVAGDPQGGWETWRVLKLLPEGLLISHQMAGRFISVELFRPGTGELFLVTDLTRLPGPAQ